MDIVIDLPAERDQLETRSLPRFTELRHHVYGEIQKANRGTAPRKPSPWSSSSKPVFQVGRRPSVIPFTQGDGWTAFFLLSG